MGVRNNTFFYFGMLKVGGEFRFFFRFFFGKLQMSNTPSLVFPESCETISDQICCLSVILGVLIKKMKKKKQLVGGSKMMEKVVLMELKNERNDDEDEENTLEVVCTPPGLFELGKYIYFMMFLICKTIVISRNRQFFILFKK